MLRQPIHVRRALVRDVHPNGGGPERLRVAVRAELLLPQVVRPGRRRHRARVRRRRILGTLLLRPIRVDGEAVLVKVDDGLAAVHVRVDRCNGHRRIVALAVVLEVQAPTRVERQRCRSATVERRLERVQLDGDKRVLGGCGGGRRGVGGIVCVCVHSHLLGSRGRLQRVAFEFRQSNGAQRRGEQLRLEDVVRLPARAVQRVRLGDAQPRGAARIRLQGQRQRNAELATVQRAGDRAGRTERERGGRHDVAVMLLRVAPAATEACLCARAKFAVVNGQANVKSREKGRQAHRGAHRGVSRHVSFHLCRNKRKVSS